MGLVDEEIEIINGGDMEMVRRHLMDTDDVKRMFIHVLIDPLA